MKHNYFSKLLIFTCLFLGFTFSFAKTLEQEAFSSVKNSNDEKAVSGVFVKMNCDINDAGLSSDKACGLNECNKIHSLENGCFHFNDFNGNSSKIKCSLIF